MNEQSITLDLRKTGFGKRVAIRQNDYHGITLAVDVTDGSKAYSVPAGAKCCLMARLLGSYVRDGGCTVEGGRIVYTADERMFSASGTAEAYFRIEVDGAVYSTEGFQLVVERAADSYAQLSEAYDTEVDRAIKGADDAAAKADDAAEGAKAAGGRADAAAKKAVEAAAKAEAGAGKVDEATDAASAAAKKAAAAAQQATAAANKVFPAADNILAGEASGTVAHAEDAFEGGALRGIAVEGACKQDGTPSSDAPKPITVVEHPTVKVASRNLWPFASSYTSIEGHQNEFVAEGTPFALLPGAYTFMAVGSLGNTDAPLFGYTATGKRFQFFRIYRNVTNPKYSFTVTEPITSIYFVSNAADSNTGTISNIQLERGSVATDYKPYTSQTLTFTLPQEHPYLAKLPDGTADEIVVDEEGNVELVARISKVIPKDADTLNFGAGTDADAPYVSFRISGLSSCTGILCNSYQTSVWTNKSGYIYCPNGLDIAIRDDRFESKEKAIELLNGVVVYVAVEPTRYPLGKIEMPKAQDSIINVWTGAEVTPNTGIGYVRDVNIVVAHLESAIASITEG